MKTKRKTIGRRSSVICVKDGLVVRRNPRRIVDKTVKAPTQNIRKISSYQSPLVHLSCNKSEVSVPPVMCKQEIPSECSTKVSRTKNRNVILDSKKEVFSDVENLKAEDNDDTQYSPSLENMALQSRLLDDGIPESSNQKVKKVNNIIRKKTSPRKKLCKKMKKVNLSSNVSLESDHENVHSVKISSPQECLPSTSKVVKQIKVENITVRKPKNKINEEKAAVNTNLSPVKIEKSQSQLEQSSVGSDLLDSSCSSQKSQKRNSSGDSSGLSPQLKKRKIKKSPLSKEGATDFLNAGDEKLRESIIVIDDSDANITEGHLDVNAKNQSEDIVIIDDDDDFNSLNSINRSRSEQDHYANIINHRDDSIQKKYNHLDSIIVIDADDDPPAATKPPQKLAEDCQVVWSSTPNSTKNAPSTSTFVANPVIKSKKDLDTLRERLLNQDKIFIDTSPDLNLNLINNTKNPNPKKKNVKRLNVGKNLVTKPNNKKIEVPKVFGAKKTSPLKKKTKATGQLIFKAPKEASEKIKTKRKGSLREIVIDGSNVAMAFTHNTSFSEKGIQLVIDYFKKKGHTVKVFLPQHRRAQRRPLLEKWYTEGIVVFTPSRKLGNKSITSYDDRYIIEYATTCGGVVVSQDQFRDLYNEKQEYRETIEKRLLVPTFVGDYVMFPEDPLGRSGPKLNEFLKH